MTRVATAQDVYRLTPLQHGMLFHALFEPQSQLYVEQIAIPFAGALHWPAFTAAWQDLTAHHEALRTSFHWEDISTPVQVVHEHARLAVSAVDLLGTRRTPEEYLAADRRAGFSLGRPPLLRVALLRAAAADLRLVLSFHHIILDGWSLQLLFRDFGLAYEARLAGRTPDLPRPGRYRDYLVWLADRDEAAAEAFWRSHLRGYAGPPALWSEPDGDGGVDPFGEHAVALPRAMTQAVSTAAARHRVTVGTAVHAAWTLALGATLGTRDVVTGVTVAGRPAELAGADATVGLFINTIPVRTAIEPDADVGVWLRRVQGALLRAREHEHTPLVQIAQWSEVPAGGALFEHLLAFENYPIQGPRPEAPVAAATFVERTNYPLSAAIVPGEHLQVRLLHDRRRLADSAVRRIAGRFELVLDALASESSGSVGGIATCTDDDRRATSVLNATQRPYDDSVTVAAAFAACAARHPGAPAVEFGERRLTYGELATQAGELALRLREAGVGPGGRVALLLDRSPELVVAMLAVLDAGAAYVPLDADSPSARLRTIVADTHSDALVVGATDRLDAARELGPPVVAVTAPSSPDGAGRSGDPHGSVVSAGHPLDTAYVMYTSGSTGGPKGIAITHRAILRLVTGTDYLQLGPDDRVGHLSNVAFDAATFEIWGPLLNGATVVGEAGAVGPESVAELVASRRLSTLFLTTALFNRVAADRPGAFAPLRTLLFGGEAVDPAAVRRVLDAGGPARMLHVYGPTEATTFATWREVDGVAAAATTVPIGRPIANTTGYVLDADLRPVPIGAVGELHLGGDGLALGYLGRPALTADAFRPDPFTPSAGGRLYRTGDRVRLLPDGFEFVGRADHQVKVRGFRIELGEIEHVLRSHPGVTGDCLVDVVTDPGGDDVLVASVAATGVDDEALRASLRELLRERLPRYMHPHRIVILPELPLTANGKVDRRALRHLGAADATADRRLVEPRTLTERRLAEIWRDVLGLERVGIHDDFFELGGHSLRATQLLSRVRTAFAAELDLREVFEAATIEELAARLDRLGRPSGPQAAITSVARDLRRLGSD